MTAALFLSRGLFAAIDDTDILAAVNAGPWYASKCAEKWYARHALPNGAPGPRSESLHTFLTGWPLVDHVNGDGLDNRRSNLRLATPTQNVANSILPRPQSGYRGVYIFRRTGRWRACIGVAGKQRHLGYFATPEQAALVYDAAARELFGEFARLNFPDDTEMTA